MFDIDKFRIWLRDKPFNDEDRKTFISYIYEFIAKEVEHNAELRKNAYKERRLKLLEPAIERARELHELGINLKEIADILWKEGYESSKNHCNWNKNNVRRLLELE